MDKSKSIVAYESSGYALSNIVSGTHFIVAFNGSISRSVFIVVLGIEYETNKMLMEHFEPVMLKPWNRSKVMIVGEGGVGKTALCNSMMGKRFDEAESRAKLTQFTCEVQKVSESKSRLIRRKDDYDGDNMIMTLLDFGGEYFIRSFHQLFFTFYGVYIVVFNMVDMLDDNNNERSLTEVSYWMNSIVTHHRQKNTGKMAPVFLVGTHGDKVTDSSMHRLISTVLEERLRWSLVWPTIVENDDICFYPVGNNDIGYQRDDTIFDLISKIECAVREADYFSEPKPVTWFRAFHELLATKHKPIALEEASRIARANGVDEEAVNDFLAFLNDTGHVLWLDEAGVRGFVILDIITFFVEPASLVTHNHINYSSENTTHLKNVQLGCRKELPSVWRVMSQRGVVGPQLIHRLLRELLPEDAIAVVTNIMLKYGYIVRFQNTLEFQSVTEKLSAMYLVPSLLPPAVGIPIKFKMSFGIYWINSILIAVIF